MQAKENWWKNKKIICSPYDTYAKLQNDYIVIQDDDGNFLIDLSMDDDDQKQNNKESIVIDDDEQELKEVIPIDDANNYDYFNLHTDRMEIDNQNNNNFQLKINQHTDNEKIIRNLTIDWNVTDFQIINNIYTP